MSASGRASPSRPLSGTSLVAALAGVLGPALVTGCSSPQLQADGGVDGAAPACALDDTYRFGFSGGFITTVDESTLSPPAAYAHSRRSLYPEPPPAISCAPPLPPCNDGALIDIADISRDLANADVQRAFAAASPPLYGNDLRPSDGAIYQLLRADGHGFLAGQDCEAGSFCNGPVPPGVARLVSDLQALDTHELADPSCAALFPGR